MPRTLGPAAVAADGPGVPGNAPLAKDHFVPLSEVDGAPLSRDHFVPLSEVDGAPLAKEHFVPQSEEDGAPLSEEDAEAHVHGICFKTGPPGRVGVELEWLVSDHRDPALRVHADRVSQAVAGLTTGDPHTALPGGGKLSTEPGGQLELSSAPATSLGGCIEAASADLAALRDATRAAGLRLSGHGLDPVRPPRRVLDLPRYAAMEKFFDRHGPWGRVMMCNTASVQVCLDAGHDGHGTDSYRSRWRLVHAIGPVLVAAFANSPLRAGRTPAWRCARQAVWARLDPVRTRAPVGAEPTGSRRSYEDLDPRDAWARFALDADLMCIRRNGRASWAAPPGLTFRDWLRGAGERRPTAADLTYHLSTLFPPVRPQGHLELRMIDAQPADGWIVPTAVVTALVDDPKAADTALAATEPIWANGTVRKVNHTGSDANPWLRAARHGPTDPGIGRASKACFEAADAALGRAGAPAGIREAVAAFTERYVLLNRCPADDGPLQDHKNDHEIAFLRATTGTAAGRPAPTRSGTWLQTIMKPGSDRTATPATQT